MAETNKQGGLLRTQLWCCVAPHSCLFLKILMMVSFWILNDGGRSRSLCTVVSSSSIAISENMFAVKICAGINNVCKKEIVVAFCY